MDQFICASLSHTHYWYEAGMLKVRGHEDYWPCAGRLSVVNTIGPQLLHPIYSGLTRWLMAVTVYMDAVVESGRNPGSKHQTQPECGRDG